MMPTLEIQLEDRRKFSKLGKDYFFYDPSGKFDPLKESQKNHKIFSLKLPDDLSECFLSKDNLTIFLLDFYKVLNNREQLFSKDSIRETLLKWFLSKTDTEKESLFITLLKLSKPNNNSYFDELLLCSFLVREIAKVHNRTLIEDKLDYLSLLQEKEENNIFKFYFNLLKVFYHIEISEWETSMYSINNIEDIGGFSPNAAFYKAQILLATKTLNEAETQLEKIIEYDLRRMVHAISNYNLKEFDTFLHNSFLQNVFNLYEGSLLYDKISTLNFSSQRNISIINKINKIIKELDKDELLEFKSEEVKAKLNFLYRVMSKYGNSRSYHFLSTLEELHNRTKAIIKELIGNIELKFEKTIDDLLKRYDEKISENQELLRNLESKNESILQKEEKRYQKLLSDFEANVSEEIKFFEEKLEDFESNSYQSTFDTIKTSLVYNFLFSSFVLLSGGFAEYTNSYVNDIANVGSLFAILIMGGLKWGVITFIIGIIISVFMVINNVHKKYVQKNSYLKRISNLNALKEKGKADLKKQYEDRKNSQNKKYTVTKQNLTEEIEAYKKSKAEEREKLKEKFKEDQSALQKPLEMLLEL